MKNKLREFPSKNLEITKPLPSFPGNHRFHFAAPHGNGYAVWTE